MLNKSAISVDLMVNFRKKFNTRFQISNLSKLDGKLQQKLHCQASAKIALPDSRFGQIGKGAKEVQSLRLYLLQQRVCYGNIFPLIDIL